MPYFMYDYFQEWVLDMQKEGKIVVCSIARPIGSSYLFFQQFKVEVLGGNLVEGKAMVRFQLRLSVPVFFILH